MSSTRTGNAVSIKKVDIRPGVSVLAVLRHLNYTTWFALGEFVDDAVQSGRANKDALTAADGPNYKLRVDIDIDTSPPARISIKDNAAGIAPGDFPRAFRPSRFRQTDQGLPNSAWG